MAANDPITELAFECDEFEQFNAAIRGWSTDFRQVEAGRADIELRHRMMAGVNALNVAFSHSTASMGSVEPGCRTFGLPDGRLGCSWCGYDVGRNHILRFDAHEEFVTVTPGGFIGRTLAVAEELLERTAHRLGFPEFMTNLDRSPDLLTVEPAAVEAFRRYYDRPMRTERELLLLVEELVLLVATTQPDTRTPGQSGPSRTVDQALVFIRSQGREAITVADVCEEVGVGYRTLDRAFKNRLGIGPKRSILAVRLHGVHDELRQADASSVAEIANAWGFWHMGDFAQRYRREFGELPSDTLQRT